MNAKDSNRQNHNLLEEAFLAFWLYAITWFCCNKDLLVCDNVQQSQSHDPHALKTYRKNDPTLNCKMQI